MASAGLKVGGGELVPAPVGGGVVVSGGGGATAPSAAAVAVAKRNPQDFLKQVIGKPIVVQLNSGVTYKGILACLDGFMNIAMEQTEEYVDGQLKARYGDCFIRGNNGKKLSNFVTSDLGFDLSILSR